MFASYRFLGTIRGVTRPFSTSFRELVKDKVFPLDNRVVFRVTGKDSRSFLHRISTNHIVDLRQGDVTFACFLTPKGSVMSEAYLYGDLDNKQSVIMDLPKEQKNLMFDYLNESKNQTDVFIEDVSEVKHIWSYLNENNDTGITLSDDTFIDPRLTIYSPLPIYRCIMEQKDIDLAKEKYAIGDLDIWNKMTLLRGLWQGPHVQGYNLYHIHTDGDNCVSDNKGCFIGKDGLAKKEESNAPRKRVIPAIISTSVANKPYTFNDIYKLENIQQLFTNEITDNVEEENTWTDGKTSGHIIFRFPKSNICLVLIPYDMPLNTHIYTEDFKYTINMVEPNWNF